VCIDSAIDGANRISRQQKSNPQGFATCSMKCKAVKDGSVSRGSNYPASSRLAPVILTRHPIRSSLHPYSGQPRPATTVAWRALAGMSSAPARKFDSSSRSVQIRHPRRSSAGDRGCSRRPWQVPAARKAAKRSSLPSLENIRRMSSLQSGSREAYETPAPKDKEYRSRLSEVSDE
jgi:hypothetical protein